jgi:twitching motility protein PilT
MADNLELLLEKTSLMKASDLHLTTGLPPVFRINGNMVRFGETPMTPEDLDGYMKQLLTPEQTARLEKSGEIDGSLSVMGKFRFRFNIYKQRGTYAMAIRHLDATILTLEQLGLADTMSEFTEMNQGIVLVTGPTGSGKSTTLATLIDMINRKRSCNIITIEDPIEFLHKHQMSIVNQREIGTDSANFPVALRAALREDPDVILIGEMRDYESIAIALTAAETGHLVLSSLHTLGAAKTIDRIIDVFPPNQQQQVRFQLSMTLSGVVSQQLIPEINGKGRKLAAEIMKTTPAIRNLIREGKIPQINNAIITGGSFGMISMDNALLKLYHERSISHDELLFRSMDSEYIRQTIHRS